MSDESGNGKYAPRPGNIPGVAMNLGGVDFVLAPLGLRIIRELEARGRELSANKEATPEMAHEFNLDAILASLHRNYPDISRGDLDALLDATVEDEAVRVVFNQSGMKRVKPGEIPPGG